MKSSPVASGVLSLLCLYTAPAFAQTNVLTNGSFESGLTGWTSVKQLAAGAAGNCSYNGVTTPGTETLTSIAGFPATDGTETALGGVQDTSGLANIVTCVLYQDVAIPAGATTATITFDIGAKGGVDGGTQTAARVGIFSTASVPGFGTGTIVGPVVPTPLYGPAVPDVVLHAQTSGSFNISGRAGQTVRFAIMNAAQNNATEMIGIDHVQLLVNVSSPAGVPTLSQWSLAGLGLLLGGAGFQLLRRRAA